MEQDIKVWYITGCASGLGLSLAKKALSLGHKVAGTSRTIEKFNKTELVKNPNFLALQTDLLNETILAETVKKTVDTFGTIDYVVNNSGFAIGGAVEEVSDKEYRSNFDINLFAPMNVIRATLPILRAKKSGHILNISSILGFSHFECGVSYNSTKWALLGVSNTLASEVAKFNIKVTAVCPGTFKTPIIDSFPLAEKVIPEYDSKNFFNKWLDRRNGIPFGDPSKYADCLIKVISAPGPAPVHLFIGPDAVDVAQLQIDLMQKELDSYKESVYYTAIEE